MTDLYRKARVVYSSTPRKVVYSDSGKVVYKVGLYRKLDPYIRTFHGSASTPAWQVPTESTWNTAASQAITNYENSSSVDFGAQYGCHVANSSNFGATYRFRAGWFVFSSDYLALLDLVPVNGIRISYKAASYTWNQQSDAYAWANEGIEVGFALRAGANYSFADGDALSDYLESNGTWLNIDDENSWQQLNGNTPDSLGERHFDLTSEDVSKFNTEQGQVVLAWGCPRSKIMSFGYVAGSTMWQHVRLEITGVEVYLP